MGVTFLHTNDLHGKLTIERANELASLRKSTDFYFDSGDAILTGNLGIPLRPEPVWPLLSDLGCDASVPGNRESHPLSSVFEKKMAGASHPIICANFHLKDGTFPLPRFLKLERNGIRIGLVAAMVEMVTPKMKTQVASAYLWDPAVPTLLQLGNQLRPEVDLLIALTHIGYRRDVELAQSGPYNVILGGHSHTVLETPERHGKTWVCQGGSHGRFAGIYEWTGETLKGGLKAL